MDAAIGDASTEWDMDSTHPDGLNILEGSFSLASHLEFGFQHLSGCELPLEVTG
jgi:hypothetical protein